MLVAGSVACGGDDDDDGNNPDAAVGDIDAPVADIDAPEADIDAPVDEADAAPPGDPSGTFLLSVVVLGQTIRTRTEVVLSKDETTADFTIQALGAPECGAENDGAPLGDPLVITGIAVENPFALPETPGEFPAGSIAAFCGMAVTGAISANGTILPGGETCGTVVVSALGMNLNGTFGSVRIDPETPPDELPTPVTACP
jgi:hypothetical protein